jgi:hypothetical protein
MINVIVKVISTDLLITKRTANLSVIKILASDDTGMVHIILKNDLIKFAKINKELIIRNAKINELNGHIYIICDELCSIFESSNLITITPNSFLVNFSEICINKLKIELF